MTKLTKSKLLNEVLTSMATVNKGVESTTYTTSTTSTTTTIPENERKRFYGKWWEKLFYKIFPY